MTEDLAQMGLSFGPGLVLAKEGLGLMNGSALLMIDYCLMSSAVFTSPKLLRDYNLSFTSWEAAKYRLLMVESKTCTLSLLLVRDWLTAL